MDQASAPKTVELGRYEAQRQAMGSLLARFTADRDALITSIEGCQEAIAALEARIESIAVAPRYPAEPGAEPAASPDQAVALDHVRKEQSQQITALRSEVARAIERADDALRKVQRFGDGEVGRLAEVQRAAVERSLEAVKAEVERIEGSLGGRVQELSHSMLEMSEKTTLGSQVAGRLDHAEEELSMLRQSFGQVEEAVRRMPKKPPASATELGLLNDLKEQMAALRELALDEPRLRTLWVAPTAALVIGALGLASILLR